MGAIDDGNATNPAASARQAAISGASRTTAQMEGVAERAGDRLWALLRKRPYLAVAATGALGFAAASAFGVGEIAFGIFAAYFAYQMLAQHEPPSKAFRSAAEIEEEILH
jgi:hypothetical protein